MRHAASEARAGSMTPEYRFQVAGVAKPSTQSLEALSGFFEDACEDILRVAVGSTLRLSAALLSKRFLILTGLAGSGKTKIAQALARWIIPQTVPADPFKVGTTIKGVQNDYIVVAVDAGIVELATKDGKLVPLPRVIIQEWADYIEANDVPESVTGRELRDKVEAESKITGYLHRLESHYKPAAFALVAARKRTESAKCFAVVPVGADWASNENILGYPDGLNATHYIARPALDLVLRAGDHPNTPHFLILDEMNLSHVERYFADFLSMMESDEGLELYSGDMDRPETWRKTSAAKPVPPKLKQLPENLFIIGTVNVDETTYMFSPKVLDRANVIEFRMDAGELEGFLGNPVKPDLAKLDGKGASFGKAFVDAAKNSVAVSADVKAAYDAEMLLLFKTLQSHGAEFGYRTAYETARFIHFYKLLGNHPDGDTAWFPGAFDCVVFQKLLPKLHGSRAKLGPVLKKLWFLCVNDAAGRGVEALKAAEDAARSTDKKAEPSVVVPTGAPYPLSAEKIGRMWRLLIENGFASFAEV
jgi:energy-coupling factor transporter ATP-binding protein EcfA2